MLGDFIGASDSVTEKEFEEVLDYDGQHRSVIEEEDQEDDSSSQLSIPNEFIDFDLVYSLRNFVATTEGQANVRKGDTLFLMDDSNSYWWLVRVLKTQDIGYIPAENIETPIERLARLNKHRNVDLASATTAEQDENSQFIHARRNPSRGVLADRRSVVFTGSSVYYYPPFVWGDPGRPLDDVDRDDIYEEDDGDYAAYEDADHYDEDRYEDQLPLNELEPDDGMSWEDDGERRVVIDPAETLETRKLSVTPFVAREYQPLSSNENHTMPPQTQRAVSISSIGSAASASEVASTDSDADSKRSVRTADRKLKKERSLSGDNRDAAEVLDRQVGEKKKVGFLGGLFGRKKDKKEIRTVMSPTDIDPVSRSSTDSVLTASVDHTPNEEASPRLASRQLLLEDRAGESYSPSRTEPSATAPRHMSGSSHSEPVQMVPLNPPTNNTLQPPSRGTRPGSLIISSAEGFGAAVPELSVLRVFAGDHLQSEATFKTVLINASTTTSGLVRQAMQRFRLPEGEDPGDYYLTIKQVDGDEAILLPDEHPLQAFEHLTERTARITARRASIGSINSISSNLSMSIAKLGMNDFTDDSTVKLYLHRAVKGGDTAPRSAEAATEIIATASDNSLSVMATGPSISNVPPERFSSPSARFAVQVYIYPEDLPDGMVFDPHTEAIVPRSTLLHRSGSSATISPGVSQTQRRKVFVFPKNTTVAEVIEASLERFGIVEGVVEGGDDIEDKPAKRRSSSRVRYGLNVSYTEGQPQRELQPSSKILDSFIGPPLFKTVDRRSLEWRRRSTESAQLMGTNDDIQSDDPTFILRKAVGIRNAKGKNAGPLDELALHQMHRESASSDASVLSSSASSQRTQKGQPHVQDSLTVKPNTHNGVDVITEAGLFRSQRQSVGGLSYTLITRTGGVVDIGVFVMEEFGVVGSVDSTTDVLDQATMGSTALLSASLYRIQCKVSRVQPPDKENATSPSVYSESSRNETRIDTPLTISDSPKPTVIDPRRPQDATPSDASRTTSPLPGQPSPFGPKHRTQPSITSVMSDWSVHAAVQHNPGNPSSGLSSTPSLLPPSRSAAMPGTAAGTEPVITQMLAILELGVMASQRPRRTNPAILDRSFLGSSVNLHDLHPRTREFFAGTLHDFEEFNKRLDHALQLSHAITQE